jgi:hypothetical protein
MNHYTYYFAHKGKDIIEININFIGNLHYFCTLIF